MQRSGGVRVAGESSRDKKHGSGPKVQAACALRAGRGSRASIDAVSGAARRVVVVGEGCSSHTRVVNRVCEHIKAEEEVALDHAQKHTRLG